MCDEEPEVRAVPGVGSVRAPGRARAALQLLPGAVVVCVQAPSRTHTHNSNKGK